MAIKFYYVPMSSSSRVHWALEELGVPYEKMKLSFDAGDLKKPEFLAINPNGKVPALVDGDAKIFESLAILLHLGDRYGEKNGVWPKADSPARGEAYAWTVWGTVNLIQPTLDRLTHASDHRMALPKEKRSQEIADKALATWNKEAAVLDKHLAGRDYTLGSAFTLVDVANASIFGMGAMMAGMPVGDHENVAAWLSRCQMRPAMGRVMSEQR